MPIFLTAVLVFLIYNYSLQNSKVENVCPEHLNVILIYKQAGCCKCTILKQNALYKLKFRY